MFRIITKFYYMQIKKPTTGWSTKGSGFFVFRMYLYFDANQKRHGQFLITSAHSFVSHYQTKEYVISQITGLRKQVAVRRHSVCPSSGVA